MAEKKSSHLLKVGEEMEPLMFKITSDLNDQYLYAEQDYHPRYWDKSESGAPLAHPSLLLNWSNSTRSPSFYLPAGVAGVHAGETAEFFSPAKVGDTITVRWKVTAMFEKRGRLWHEMECLATNQDGTKILRRVSSSAFMSKEPLSVE